MREQIEAISKQVEKIKEIAFSNKEHLEFAHKDLTEWEIDKIREAQKTTADIIGYNIMGEYKKLKKINNYIRLWYLLTIVIIVVFLVMITWDYINVKIKNEDVKNIEKQKIAFEKQNKELKTNLEQNLEKNNSLSSLIKQKDEQIEILKKWLNEQITLNSQTIKNQLKDNDETKIEDIKITDKNNDIKTTYLSWTTSNSWTTKITETENKKCVSNTTITINVRDTAWIDGKVLSFLNEWTQVEVLTKQTKNDRVWYEIQTSKITGWISSVWIEEFDSTCLK